MDVDSRRIVRVWLLLLVLLALTAGSAWLHLGAWNNVINLAIAAAKSGLVLWWYMELRRRDGLLRIVAGAGLALLLLLLGLSGSDYATRVLWRAPWQVPPSVGELPRHGQHFGQVQRHASGCLRDLLAAAVAVGH